MAVAGRAYTSLRHAAKPGVMSKYMKRILSEGNHYLAIYDDIKEVRMGILVADITIYDTSNDHQIMHFKEVILEEFPWSSATTISVRYRYIDGCWTLLHLDVDNLRYCESKSISMDAIKESEWKYYNQNPQQTAP
ncbi:hypothetical protein [Bacterioplanoides sp. SCSIO 12839]|uniref:hypothetical protein n=1 Tax=Bacterioplanoides sp. SCSIO 12839 TaxID=2829569 RepID=UPI002105B4B4|nr:hypothetical protein [Bacterioplanoides sp. SCSIO 12839]UTW47721.1 hypothetical protein KFF03_14280 [Bacterioplanoides sp. SCSIO 12839]